MKIIHEFYHKIDRFACKIFKYRRHIPYHRRNHFLKLEKPNRLISQHTMSTVLLITGIENVSRKQYEIGIK